MECAAILENSSTLSTWSWFSSTYQQYHTIIHFLLELQENPGLAQAERIGLMFDHVFGPVYGISRAQRVLDLLCLLRDCLNGYYRLRGLKSKDDEALLTTAEASYTAKDPYHGMSPNIKGHWFRTPQAMEMNDWSSWNSIPNDVQFH
jgi:hypothetical protein